VFLSAGRKALSPSQEKDLKIIKNDFGKLNTLEIESLNLFFAKCNNLSPITIRNYKIDKSG